MCCMSVHGAGHTELWGPTSRKSPSPAAADVEGKEPQVSSSVDVAALSIRRLVITTQPALQPLNSPHLFVFSLAALAGGRVGGILGRLVPAPPQLEQWLGRVVQRLAVCFFLVVAVRSWTKFLAHLVLQANE